MSQPFEHLGLKEDLENLAGEVKERAQAETPEAHREAIKTVVGEKITAEKVSPAPVSPSTSSAANLPNYLQNADPQVKLEVQKLVEVAWHKGLSAAIKLAQEAGPLYVDALHDTLTDKLYDEFKKQKLL